MRIHIMRLGTVAALALSCCLGARVAWAGPLEEARAAYSRRDYATALGLLRPLAEQGDAGAQNDLGWMYSHGDGVKQDFKEAIRLYQSAAKQGNASAQYNLGVIYYEGSGTPQDFKEAFKLYRAAATGGDVHAQYNLGFMYANAKGTAKDLVRGGMWWDVASGNGSVEAWASLETIARLMSKEQIAQAQAMARNCRDSGYKECN
jgi:TPR repeat protein